MDLSLSSHVVMLLSFHICAGPTGGQDISCTFGSLSGETDHNKANYLDQTEGYTIGDHTTMTDRIKEMTDQEKCRNYHLTKNNCEHLVTYVRYGRPHSEQVCNRLNSIPSTCFLNLRTIIITIITFNWFYVLNQPFIIIIF